MKNAMIIFFLCITAFSISAQEDTAIIIDRSQETSPWSNLEFNNSSQNFRFAIVGDRTGGHRPGVFMEAVQKLNLLQPEFVMSVGDLIEGYTMDEEEINRQWREFNSIISHLKMPFFYVPGNHDYINEVMAAIWEEKFGRSYYHFVYKDVLFLCLNSEEATKGSNMGGIEKEQFHYIKEVLSENQDVRWTLVFMHQPLWILDDTRYWNEVEKLLENREHTVFAGHHHHYVKFERNNGKYFMLATTGGFSQLRGPDYGEFDQLAWVTMTNEGPVVANLLLEGIWDEDVVNEQIMKITSSNPVKFQPLISETSMFRRGELKLKLVNDENVPMSYTITVSGNENLEPDSAIMTGRIPPNNVEQKQIILSSAEPLGIDRTEPLSVEAKFIYHLESGRQISMMKEYRVAPVKYREIERASKKKKVDGNLEDWGILPYAARDDFWMRSDTGAYSGPADCSFNFGVEYDDDFLYIGIRVEDDEILLDPKSSTWNQDAIRLHIDPRTSLLSAGETDQQDFSGFEGIYFSPAAGKNDSMIVYQTGRLPEGTRLAARVNENEINYEVAVPMTWIMELAGGNWQNLRLNIGCNDADKNGTFTRLWWKPEWRSGDNYLGSGLFRKY